MTATLEPLIRDFVGWIAAEPRPYAEVMETWRTSCPRLTVWEDAVDRGLVLRRARDGGPVVEVAPLGRTLLAADPQSPA